MILLVSDYVPRFSTCYPEYYSGGLPTSTKQLGSSPHSVGFSPLYMGELSEPAMVIS